MDTSLPRLTIANYGLVLATGSRNVTWYPTQKYSPNHKARTYYSNESDPTQTVVSVIDDNTEDDNAYRYRLTANDGSIMEFGPAGNLLSRTDNLGNTTEYSYYTESGVSEGLLKSIHYADDSVMAYGYDTSGNLDTQRLYAHLSEYENSQSTAYVETDYDIDSAGLLRKVTFDSDTATKPFINFLYDVSSDSSALGDTTHGTKLLRRVTDQLGQSTKISYDYNTNQVTSIEKPCGGTSYYGSYLASALVNPLTNDYANRATPLHEIDTLNSSFNASIYQGSDTKLPNDKTVTTPGWVRNLGWIKDEAGNVTFRKYDSNGYLIQEVNALNQRTSYTYLPNGMIESMTEHDRNVGQSQVQDRTTEYEYDDYYNVTKTKITSYDGIKTVDNLYETTDHQKIRYS